jgi:predicted dehydrogenase
VSFRIIIAGFGSIGQKHFANVRQLLPEAEIAILRSVGPTLCLPGLSACFYSIDEALDFNPAAVIISSPATLHEEQALAFMNGSRKLLIEKPLASSLKGAERIRDAAINNKVRVILGYNLRYFQPLRLFKDLIIHGKYGKLQRLECHVGQHLSEWRQGKSPSLSVSSKKELGGGAFRELSHEIDYCLWICGHPITVKGRASRHLDYGTVEDCADLWLEFANGVHASIHLDMIDHVTRRSARAICELATLEFDFLSSTIRMNGEILNLGEVNSIQRTYADELEDLIGSEDASPAATCEDGVAVLDVIEKAEKSAVTG